MTLPHGWTSRRFDQLGELCSGSTPSSSRTEYWEGATVWVTPTDLSRLNTPYLHDSAKHITERGLRNCSARLLPPGSIVLSSRAPIGYVAIPTVPFCTNQGCKSIALHNSYHSEFVYYAVTAAVPRLKQLGEGTTFAEISKSSLAKAEVVLPIDKAEQSQDRRGVIDGGSGDRGDRGAHRQAAAHQDRPDAGPAHPRHRRARQPPLRTDPQVQRLPARGGSRWSGKVHPWRCLFLRRSTGFQHRSANRVIPCCA